MTKNRIVKYAANTALLAVLAAAGIGVYQIGTYTPDKEIQEELQTDQSEDTPMVDADTSLVDAEISDTTGQNDTAEEKITQTLTDSADSSEKLQTVFQQMKQSQKPRMQQMRWKIP